MTMLLSESEKKDIYKSHIFQLCNFLIEERRPPKCTTVTGPIKIPLKDFAVLSEYTDASNNELKIEKLKQTLEDLNSDYISEDRPITIITIVNEAILANFQESYNNNEKIIVKCSKERLEDYKDKLKRYANDENTAVEKVIKSHNETTEKIKLSVIGVEIEGKDVKKGRKNKFLNPTDRAIIYHLYYKSLKSEDECFTLKVLSESKEINKDSNYIRNRITIINILIKNIVSEQGNLRIPKFIKREGKRGYHLNPKVMHKTLT
ncbi:MAG: hypothetical protein WCO09_00345 [bacterium]